jgi:hypothetical protein
LQVRPYKGPDCADSQADSAGSIPITRSEAVKGLRAYGYSWAEIGSRLGTTRQAAQQRGHSENDPPARISRNPGH